MPYEPNMDEMMFFDGKPQALGLYASFDKKLFALCPRYQNAGEENADHFYQSQGVRLRVHDEGASCQAATQGVHRGHIRLG